MYHIISYILISHIYTTTIRNMYHFSFLLHLFYYTFSLSGFSSLFLFVLLVSLYTIIISTISQSLFPGSCFSSLILCSFAKAFSIIFLSIKLDCSIFYSIHYLRLYTLTIYIYIIFTWITRFVHFIYI